MSTIARRASLPEVGRREVEVAADVVSSSCSSSPFAPGLNRKNSASMPAFIVNPMLSAFARTVLESAAWIAGSMNGSPPGLRMSQIRRQIRLSGSPQG